MPLMDHLGELRRRLTIIVVSLFTTAIVLYFASPVLIQFLIDPVREFLPDLSALGISSESGLLLLTPLGGFSLRFKVAIFAAFVVCSPIVIWEIMAFFLPALRPNERRWVVPTLAAAVFLFVFGVVFGYNFILGPAFGWLTSQSEDFAAVWPDAQSYINTIIGFMLAFGVAFELPLVVFYLVVFNLVPYKKFRSNWRTIYVVLLVFCAMVTPDASPVTMVLMYAALVVLYELSLFVARFVLAKRIAKQKADGTWVDPDEDDEDEDEDDED